MCQKVQNIWQCGHSDTEDPRRCRIAYNRNKASCQEYGFVWAFRDPVIEKWEGECRDCRLARREREKSAANKKFVEQSQAYPVLRDVSSHDDETRRKTGRPRFDRSASTSPEEVRIPPGWTPAQNRLPSNANEYEQFVRGRFNPLEQLPDTHVPPEPVGPVLHNGPRPPPPSGQGQGQWQPRPQSQHTQFQPYPHAFMPQNPRTHSQTQRVLAAPGAPPKPLASRVPRPHTSHQRQIAQYTISRHQSTQITPPQDSAAQAGASQGAVILQDTDYPYIEFRNELSRGRRQTHEPAREMQTQTQMRIPGDHQKRRPSFAGGGGGSARSESGGCGWLPPPNTSPLPLKLETDTAPPSRNGSRSPVESGVVGVSRSA
ncbi:hypothetical protein BDV97DRAFT_402476 [Delphinella strobiligena]|nr:hypothetical protein BDV97DRAFT_402476 [Delphinella strobiligena]